MEELRKRRQPTPEEKFQIYNEATIAKAQGNGSITEVLRRWGIHSSDLTRIKRTVPEGSMATFKANRSRKPKIRLSEDEIMALKRQNERLERTVLELAAEVALLKKRDRSA